HDDDCCCGHHHHDEEEHEHHHHHDHDEECCCGHHHHDEEEHEHHHHHEHDEECGCGHHHHHDEEEHEHHHHDHGDGCCCGHHHDDDDDDHAAPVAKSVSGKTETRVYIVENLGCANCAAKMERRINELPEVAEATLTFATKQLKVTANHTPALLGTMQKICASIEGEVKLVEKERKPEPKKGMTDNKKDLITIAVGAVLFVLGVIFEKTGLFVPMLITLIAGYLVLGGEVLITAFKNLLKGHVFDENFLMSIATLGAFAIQDYPEAVGVMLFYRVGEWFEHIAVERSRTQIMDAVDMRPEVVNLVTAKGVDVIPAEEAEVGDILLVRPGDRIPLDGVVIEGESRIDTSPVTGEPVPVTVRNGDEVISGCVNTNGLLKIRVEKVLEESMVTRILDSVENAAAGKPKIDRFITRFARIYTPAVVAVATLTAVVPPLFFGQSWSHWIHTALSFLVMSCPCALVLSVPLAFFSGIGAGSRQGILFKGGVSLETMAEIKAVVMDKTGTVTEGNFVVQSVVPVKGAEETDVLRFAGACERSSTHPVGISVLKAAEEKKLSVPAPTAVEEIAGHGIRATVDGKTVLCGNRKLMVRFEIDLTDAPAEGNGTEVLLAMDGKLMGVIRIGDTVKQDAVDAVATLKRSGIATVMLTGDNLNSAQAVAKTVGVDEVYAKLLPEEKLAHLVKARSKYGKVMFVGDGINDAPVLAGADVGAAMGSGADAAIDAADVVFMTSEMSAVPKSLSIAKAATGISRQNVIFAIAVKIIVMILGLCDLLGPAAMWMAVFADTGVAMICILNAIRILYSKKYR
ncbi:MAG: cadmium-translocating P-type ATPase, partial [Clostridia bacterium]|nr:cadmium-translocating P-type ATPase [Clostridia bacterium]